MNDVGAVNSMIGNAEARMNASLRGMGAPAGDVDAFGRMVGAGAGDSFEAKLRTAAEKLVSSAFIMPVLSSMREASQAASPFAPGVAERRFGPLLDERIADSIVQSANFNLVDSIVDRYRDAALASSGIEVKA